MSKIATNGPRRSGLPVAAASPSSTTTNGRNSSLGSHVAAQVSGTSGPRLSARRSQVGLRAAAHSSAGVSSAVPLPQTPRRSVTSTSNGRATPSYAESRDEGSSQARKLEIGDEVFADVNSVRYIGVLRHLGPVHFRPGIFAGLELTGSSEGRGRNDGCVEGQQYFACEPENGIFFLATRVRRLGGAPSTEATARPQSALSQRSGRSSALDESPQQQSLERPSSVTPGRPRAGTSSASVRGKITTPFRPSSRNASGRPLSRTSRGGSYQQTPALPDLPRHSGTGAAGADNGNSRVASSAEEARRAEERITEGSRAHKLLTMNAKDLRARQNIGQAPSAFTPSRRNINSTITTSLSTAPKHSATSVDSPLKKGLLGQKGRASMGSAMAPSAMTSRTSKGRQSLQSQASSTAMAPPSDIPASPTKSHTSLQDSASSDSDPNAQRKLSLLEQMDLLTPRRPIPASPKTGTLDQQQWENSQEYGRALAPSEDDFFDGEGGTEDKDSLKGASGVVPVSLFEKSNMEVMELKTLLAEAQLASRDAESAMALQVATEVERAKAKAIEEARNELEEDRRIEQQDNIRRKNQELSSHQREWEQKNDGLQRELKDRSEELDKMRSQQERKINELATQLHESETLVVQLKATIASADTFNAHAEASRLELMQVKERLDRAEAARKEAQHEHEREIDDLKSAGQEALDLYVGAENISKSRIAELEDNLRLLQDRAQEAITEAERQRDEAVRESAEASAWNRQAATNAVSQIDHQSLLQQLEQAQNRATLLEDQVAEVNAMVLQEREVHVKRRDRHLEVESKMKEDLAVLKSTVRSLEKSDFESRRRVEELNDALEQSNATLESERAELETLRAEALILGDAPNSEVIMAAEKSRHDAEVERLQGLLEGARSGKREASRQGDELRAQNEELHALLKETRAYLSALEGEIGRGVEPDSTRCEDSAQTLLRLRNDMVTSKTGNDTIEGTLQQFEKELVRRDCELLRLRQRLGDNAKNPLLLTNAGSVFDAVPSRGVSMDAQRSPGFAHSLDSSVNHALTSPGWSTGRRVSTASTVSRRSFGHNSGSPKLLSTSEGAAKELAGLRSLVNTLNQELTEQKVMNTQRERVSTDQLEKLRTEARRLELQLEEEKAKQRFPIHPLRSDSASTSASIDARVELEGQVRAAEVQITELRTRLDQLEKAKREEARKLNRDISELEALCEATVWRREEQEAKREELERTVAHLQQQLALHGRTEMSGQERPDSAMTISLPASASLSSNAASGTPGAAAAALRHSATASILYELTCDDCGETGHKMEQCPYVNDDMLF